MTKPLGPVGAAKYVLLTSFRKDGTPVGTPLWAVAENDKLYVWTPAEAWKVKRIRRNASVTLRPCSASGTPQGDEIEGTATILGAEETKRVRKLLMRKYWLAGPPVVLGSVLRRGGAGTVGIEITPTA